MRSGCGSFPALIVGCLNIKYNPYPEIALPCNNFVIHLGGYQPGRWPDVVDSERHRISRALSALHAVEQRQDALWLALHDRAQVGNGRIEVGTLYKQVSPFEAKTTMGLWMFFRLRGSPSWSSSLPCSSLFPTKRLLTMKWISSAFIM